MSGFPKKPGNYLEYETRNGYIRYAPLTRQMAARRKAIALALGYVLPERCTLCNVYGDNGRRFECWEQPDSHDHGDGKMASSFHHRFVNDLSRYDYAVGAIGFWWPDDVEAAVSAIDKRKPLPDDEPSEPTASDAWSGTAGAQ